jgi:hypothetical protein
MIENGEQQPQGAYFIMARACAQLNTGAMSVSAMLRWTAFSLARSIKLHLDTQLRQPASGSQPEFSGLTSSPEPLYPNRCALVIGTATKRNSVALLLIP